MCFSAGTLPATRREPAGVLGEAFRHRDAADLPVEGRLPSFAGATGWPNSEPLTPEGLRGRVVLVDFWTYSRVNRLRTVPYVRAWAAKYAAQGPTTIGVHAPEVDFEPQVSERSGTG